MEKVSLEVQLPFEQRDERPLHLRQLLADAPHRLARRSLGLQRRNLAPRRRNAQVLQSVTRRLQRPARLADPLDADRDVERNLTAEMQPACG